MVRAANPTIFYNSGSSNNAMRITAGQLGAFASAMVEKTNLILDPFCGCGGAVIRLNDLLLNHPAGHPEIFYLYAATD